MVKSTTMRSVRKLLSLAGFVSCLAGACLLFITSYPTISRQLHPDVPDHSNAIYVGSESCFTCHETLNFAWSGPLHPRQIDAPLLNPQRTVTDVGALPIGAVVTSLPMQPRRVNVAYLADDWSSSAFSASFTIPGSQEENLP